MEQRSRAEDVFAEYLRRAEEGAARPFEELCAEHPDLAPALDRLEGEWRALGALARRLGQAAPSVSGAGGPPSLAAELAARHGLAPGSVLDLDLEPRAPRAAEPQDAPPTFGRYEVRGELGRGGMGVVHEAWDPDLKRRLAIKRLTRPESGRRSEELRRLGRFLEEAQVTAQLEHPAVVPVYDLGLDLQGEPFLALRRVEGHDLDRVLELARTGHDGWTTTRVLHAVLRACEALAYAHARGVVHRDLKPANVRVGRFGEVYVMDWGLARVLGRPGGADVRPDAAVSSAVHTDRRAGDPGSPLLTMDGDVIGTPCYMAPEQARGELERIGPPSDVYSVGALLYHLLAGHAPYAEPSAPRGGRAVWVRLVEGPPRPLEERAPGTAPELFAICRRAMAREPAERYPSVIELADDLRAFLEGRVVRAHRTGPWVELSKWVGRNRATAAALAAALVAVVAGVFTVGHVRAGERVQREIAAAQTDLAQATRAFLVDLFQAPRPDFALGEPLSARDVLERGAERIGGALREAPRARASLMGTVGASFLALGDGARAEPLLREALELRVADLGERDPEALDLRVRLAEARYRQDDLAAAERLLLECLAIARATGAGGTVALVHLDLATLRVREGRFDEAEELFESALANPDVSGRVALQCRINRGQLRGNRGRHRDAIPDLERALADARTALPERHPMRLNAAWDLAAAYDEIGRFDDAAPLHAAVVRDAEQVYGTSHSVALRARYLWAVHHARRGARAEAEALLRPVLAAQRERHGPAHSTSLETLALLTTVLQESGRHAEAGPLVRELVELREREQGPDDPETLLALHNLATQLEVEGDRAGAEATYRDVLGRADPSLEAARLQRARTLQNLAILMLRDGRAAEEETWDAVREALETNEALRGPDAAETIEARLNQAYVLLARGRVAEAEPVLERVDGDARRVLGPRAPLRLHALRTLGEVQLHFQRQARAEAYFREALEIQEAIDADDPACAELRDKLDAARETGSPR